MRRMDQRGVDLLRPPPQRLRCRCPAARLQTGHRIARLLHGWSGIVVSGVSREGDSREQRGDNDCIKFRMVVSYTNAPVFRLVVIVEEGRANSVPPGPRLPASLHHARD
jgi:hypothetical protein